MHFKHKYITQPTLTLEDTIIKALNDLIHALKERRNKYHGNEEMEASQKLNKIGKMTHIPGFSKMTYRRTALSFLPIVEQQI